MVPPRFNEGLGEGVLTPGPEGSQKPFVDTSRIPKEKLESAVDGGGLDCVVSSAASVNEGGRVDISARTVERSLQEHDGQESWSESGLFRTAGLETVAERMFLFRKGRASASFPQKIGVCFNVSCQFVGAWGERGGGGGGRGEIEVEQSPPTRKSFRVVRANRRGEAAWAGEKDDPSVATKSRQIFLLTGVLRLPAGVLGVSVSPLASQPPNHPKGGRTGRLTYQPRITNVREPTGIF